MKLKDYQKDAINSLQIGNILCGGVGSGKSVTSIAYYCQRNGGQYEPFKMMTKMQDLVIITTAKKRDSHEWGSELHHFLLDADPSLNAYGDKIKITIDSWNNIKKYVDVKDAFFIFDEQRVVGYGAWTKAFLKITQKNDWILLTATPGDTWSDYIPVFIANGFYRNITEFRQEHVIYDAHCTQFPKIKGYANTRRLVRLRDRILIKMDFDRQTIPHHEDVLVSYDASLYRQIFKERWDIYEDRPIENVSEFCALLRRVVYSDESRAVALLEIAEKHPKLIVFYNYDFELEILRGLDFGDDRVVAEWNGHAHDEVPDCSKWVYLVQYTAGCEGWNCIKTNCIVFYSQNYSYKVMTQACGRIDRLNTPYTDLYYYHLKSTSSIDRAVAKALREKKDFNEGRYFRRFIDQEKIFAC